MGKGKSGYQSRRLKKIREREQQRRRRQRRNRIIFQVLIGIIVLGMLGGIVLAFVGGTSKPLANGSPSPGTSLSPGTSCNRFPGKPQTTKQKYPAEPKSSIDTKKAYTALMHTTCGDIALTLFPKTAPRTVNSFVFLARHGFFNGLKFHRVVPGFVIQGGDPAGDGSGGPGYNFPNEPDATHKFDRAGVLAMANSGPNTNGSQFFITVGPTPALTSTAYTIFGAVASGQDVANKIVLVPTATGTERPIQDVIIINVKISESA